MINLDAFYSSSQFKGTSGSKLGREGYVPQAQIGESGNYLRGDGKWVDFGLANLTSASATVATLSSYWESAIQAVNGTANQIVATNTGTNNHNNQTTLSFAQSAVFPGDVLIPGTLTVTGTATYINTKNLIIDDPIIFLANNNPANLVDTGFVSHFKLGPPLNNTHTGLVRRANQGVPGYWTLFSGLTTEPLTSVNIDWNDKNIKLDTLSANIATNNGTSDNWNSNFTTTNSNSANWSSVYTTVNSNSGNYILDGGNTKGANLSIGSNDGFNLNIETNNTNRISILSSGETKFLTKYGLLSTTVPSAEFSSGIIVGTDVATLSSYNIPTGYNIGQFSTNGLLIGQNDVGAYVGNVSISENSFSVIPSSIGTNNSLKLGGIVGNFDGIATSSDGRYVTITTDTVGIYAGRTGGVIYVSNDFGNTFTARITDDPTRRFFNAAMSVDGRIQYVTAITVNNSGLWASYDYGVTWTRQLTLDLRGLATSSDGRIVVAGITGGVGIYISRDYGANWNLINSTIGATKIAISSDGRIIAVVNTNGNITTSFDYGNSWETRSITTGWTDVAMSADGKNQIASSQTSSNGGVFVSNDYGVSWTRRLGPGPVPYTGVCMSSCGKYMFATLYRQSSPFVIPGRVFMSTNYGATFAALSIGDNNWQRIKCSSDGRILYITSFQFNVNGTDFYSSYGQIYNQSSITVNNTISSSSIIFASGGNSDSWNSVYTTTNTNSARWQSNYTSFNSNSAKYDSSWTTTNSNSANWTQIRSIQTSDFTASQGSYYIVNTSSTPITGALPVSPAIGTTITFQDSFIQWQTNNFTLNRSGNMIQGLNENMICDRGGVMFSVTYIGGSVGWRVN